MGMETLGNTGIVAGGMGAGVQPMIDLGGYRNNNNCGDGMFGNQGIWAILLLALLGRRGFGDGDGGCGNGQGCALPVITNDNINTKFNNLSDQIQYGTSAAVSATQHQGVVDAVRSVDAQVCAGFLQTANGFGQTRLDAANGFGITNDNINRGFGNTNLELCKGFGITNNAIAESKYQGVIEGQRNTAGIMSGLAENRFQVELTNRQLAAQLAECCCEIRMEGMQNTQKILDKMSCTEVQDLRDKLAESRLTASQCAQNAAIIGALAPKPPVAAYPVWNNAPIFTPTVSAQSFCGAPGTAFGNPGCGGGGCGIL